MKYAIMSDAHANPAALRLAMADARKMGCEKLVMLGDVTGYGYDVKTMLKLVRENFDVVLMGNHDSACLGRERKACDRRNPNYDLDRAQKGVLGKDEIAWLREREFSMTVDGMGLTHGDFTEPRAWNYIQQPGEVAVNFHRTKEPLLFCGHTHHAEVWELRDGKRIGRPSDKCDIFAATKARSFEFKRKEGSRYLVNVGSVGYPRADFCSTYAICDPAADSFALRALPFDMEEYINSLLRHNIELPGWMLYLAAIGRGNGVGVGDRR